ncbi:hypothetical protein [Dactylosporangium matsuzakiense]|uniref:Uncharacterized protein n=1 Tax=Dactylosporangium matsuzakiense TaxID=53360 RepID=A0A9W6KY49_9ACTN|nr:hypothetical protein [Dactylosporangium matsuzakiense]UWZ42804.1 hypothetical protein Dmats_35530 [Dactylosporangium matsuzakiense]GLL08555.1 hypothetical protein GCM10017581_103220 [Dactylosporangium matsuzakiense]
MAVKPPAERVAQDRSVDALADGAFDRSGGYRGRKRDRDDFAAFAAHAQDAVAYRTARITVAG